MAGGAFHIVLSGFIDNGRVWKDDLQIGELVSDLTTAYGGGVRLGLGENFVVAVDVGHSDEAAAPIYIGLGYLY